MMGRRVVTQEQLFYSFNLALLNFKWVAQHED